MILNWISILFLSVVILIFIFLIIRPSENFSESTNPVFANDDSIKRRIKEYEEEKGIIIKQKNKQERENEYDAILTQIEQKLENFKKTFDFMTDNINNFPVCSESDLRWDLAPTDCSSRSKNRCELNPWCNYNIATSSCEERERNRACKAIMLDFNNQTHNTNIHRGSPPPNNTCTQSTPCLRKKASTFFINPETLEEVKRLN